MPNLSELIESAKNCFHIGEFERAKVICQEVLDSEPEHSETLFILGCIAGRDGVPELAEGYFQRSIASNPDQMEIYGVLARTQQQLGNKKEARENYQYAVDLCPNSPVLLNNYGNFLCTLGEYNESIRICLLAIKLDPLLAPAHNNLGTAYWQTGKLEEAQECFQKALSCSVELPEAIMNLGAVLHQREEFEQAIVFYRRFLKFRPNSAEGHDNLGLALKSLGQLENAVEHFRQAIELDPSSAQLHNNLGTALQLKGKLDRAQECYETAIRLQPDHAEAHNNLGNLFRVQGLVEQAVAASRQAVKIHPDFAVAQTNLGNALLDHGQVQEAISCYKKALQTDSGDSQAYVNLGVALQMSCQFEAARESFKRSQEINPRNADAHYSLSMLKLLLGEFESGWHEYEWRQKIAKRMVRKFTKPFWDGETFSGRTLLIHCEQGLGDTIQFLRYILLAKQRGGSVILLCQEPLKGLVTRSKGIDQLITPEEPLPEFDSHIPLLSLPRVFGTKVETIPNEVPYLSVDNVLEKSWADRFESIDGFRVGIAWQGNPDFVGDQFRSIPLEEFESLKQVSELRLVKLQKGSGTEQIEKLGNHFALIDFDSNLEGSRRSMVDTAAIMMNLDLVITSDTSVAHLAGALGCPVWVLLQYSPDWRWLLERSDSPWYPSMRLFRQNQLGDWKTVIEGVAAELQIEIANRSINRPDYQNHREKGNAKT